MTAAVNRRVDKARIVDAAFALLNEQGLDKFNLRALTGRLNTTTGALYWYFNNKDDLLRAMVSRIFTKAYAAMEGCSEWDDALRTLGLALRDALNEHRDSALLCSRSISFQEPQAHMERISAPLIKAGLDRETALVYEGAVISFVLGWSIYHQNQEMSKYLNAMFDLKESFDVGLDALIEGLKLKQ